MRTRRIHLVDDDTVSALFQYCAGRTRRGAAVALGLPKSSAAMLSDVLNRKPSALSEEGERDLRQRLGRPVLDMRPVPVCPLHGEPHVADCHGRAVAAVVALAPGERVVQAADVSRETLPVRKPRTRTRYLRPCLSLDPETRMGQLRDLMAKCQLEMTCEWEDALP